MKSMFGKMLCLLLSVLFLSLPLFAAGQAESSAEAYPTKEITCIVIAAAGGGTDAMARAVSTPLEKLLGKPIVIMNNGSAGGLIAMGDIKNAKPDGYTIGVFSNTDVANFAHTQKDLPISVDDYTYIAGLNTTGDILVLKKGSSFSNTNDMIEYAKKNPKAFTIALPSPIQEMSLSLINEKMGIQTTGVVYSGGNKVFADLLGGHIEAGILSAKFIQQAQDQGLTILGLMLSDRLSSFPEVKTFKEQGYAIDNPARRMLVGPKGMSDVAVKKLVENLKKGYEGPMIDSITTIGEVPALLVGAELEEFLKADFAMRKAFLTK
ncbi:MAG: tripartite tricarboxylate transporter substrate binding protein [Sphaerochaeta sp.]|jgi:tripartite-type tricarboxylate transporter receptor subunit TctC|nr:tripartite tricarboxylate transporter substrate binding protein [Sphaerochaeta sp.]